MPYKDIHDAIGVRKIGEGVFESVQNPERMGNVAPIAYGGCQLGFAARVAHQGVAETHRLYSMTGNFLGPAQIDRKLLGRIQELRRTRTFVTRLVTVSQKQDDGRERALFVSLVDFHAPEPAELFRYSAPPHRHYPGPAQQPSLEETRDALLASGALTPAAAKMYRATFGLASELFEFRACRGALNSETLVGFAKEVKTEQDELPVHERSSADWWRCRAALTSREEQAATLAYQMDRAISFIPLINQHMSLADAGACSTLDFALRVFDNDFDLTQWHHSEWKCVSAAAGRTYSESRLWDEKGNMVASMTQSCIMRPLKKAAAKL